MRHTHHPARARAPLHVRVLALAALLGPSSAATASGEFVTQGFANCNSPIFTSGGSEARLDVYDDATEVTAWGFGMDHAQSVTSSNPAVAAHVSATTNGPDNGANGCQTQGSADIVIERVAGQTLSSPFATLTVHFPFGEWQLPVAMQTRVGNVNWAANTALQACLEELEGDLYPTPGSTSELTLEIPQGLLASQPDPRRDCLGNLSIAAALVPNRFIDARPISVTWSGDALGGPANDGPSVSGAPCLRGTCSPSSPVTVRPRWSDLAQLAPDATLGGVVKVRFGGETMRMLRLRAVGVARQAPPPPPPSVTVSVFGVGGGGGRVTSGPAGIDCTAGQCFATFLENTNVGLTPTPTADSIFSGWGGDCTGTGACQFFNGTGGIRHAEVSAQFTRVFRLTVVRQGPGRVSGSGINCGGGGQACQVPFTNGNTAVSLVAEPDVTHRFVRWEGVVCNGGQTGTGCTFNMGNQDRTVTAVFE